MANARQPDRHRAWPFLPELRQHPGVVERVQAHDEEATSIPQAQGGALDAGREAGTAHVARRLDARLLQHGLYVIAFSYPVVPQGKARIRTQMSAAHSDADIDQAVAAFVQVGKEMGVVS